MNAEARLPFIPENITVHLGRPSDDAANVTVSFPDYIKNVASSEIYPTWPEESIRANILAQISFALNRVYSEYYRSRGYDFDITNSTQTDQSYVEGRDIFENISRIVDEIFNDYLKRDGSIEPLFAAYCDGVNTTCRGLSQWGSVELANSGLGYFDILKNYYGEDILLVSDAPVVGISESYPDRLLRLGSSGNDVRSVQVKLNRISSNYPSIPKIPSADGIFGTETDAAVRRFQEIFSLSPDGVVGRATWYSIIRIYNAVKRISDVASEGIPLEDALNVFESSLEIGDQGPNVGELQYFLNFLSIFDPRLQPLNIDGIFGENTRDQVIAFQRNNGLSETGVVTPSLWDVIYSAYVGALKTLPDEFLPPRVALYPGFPIRIGSEGADVEVIQEYLNYISNTYREIPKITADGIFGAITEEAVKAYQSLFGLTTNGIVGSVTWNSLVNTFLTLFEGEEKRDGQFGGSTLSR